MRSFPAFELLLLLLVRAWVRPVEGASLAEGLSPMIAPTKGHMRGVVGNLWTMQVDTSDADHLDFLPAGDHLGSAREEELRNETLASFRHLKDFARYRGALMAGGYYTSGKGFQKVGMVCLLLERFFGSTDERTRTCAGWLARGFACFYEPSSQDRFCRGASASYYDANWGGIASRHGWDRRECNSDYGNTCYNDHHYHFGYFVVSAAILAKLQPQVLENTEFVDYVNVLIRDTTNPSSDDGYFPQFRAFDWFDLHSWSHGLSPMYDGKDQESTSEELNLLYGLHLWGRVTGNVAMRELGTTMLALAANTIREFFLMKDGNPYHPPAFVKNRVTGIFFQAKVDYTTWFGGRPEHIHGIQMLPLSAALQLTRRPDFCQQEWDDILSKVDLNHTTKAWASILLTGGLAVIQPELAYHRLRELAEGEMDNGLTRAWALYWAATKPGLTKSPGEAPPAASPSEPEALLAPVSAARPSERVFPRRDMHPVHPPVHSEVAGAKATNKFWANWVVSKGDKYPIFSMPYALSWGRAPGGGRDLRVAQGNPPHYIYSRSGDKHIKAYITASVTEFALGVQEPTAEYYRIVREGIFGIHAELRGDHGRKVTFPILSGMAYVSGRYTGGFTPAVWHPHGLAELQKVTDGIWSFRNRREVTFRVYVLDSSGGFVDGSYDFDRDGKLNKPLEGWVRIARVVEEADTEVLDAHARAVVVGCELELEAGGAVRYSFQTEGARDVELLHWAYGHHVHLLSQGRARILSEGRNTSILV